MQVEAVDLVLSDAELRALTGYARPTQQLAELHRRGFHRARRIRDGSIVLERAHYLAIRDKPPAYQVSDELAAMLAKASTSLQVNASSVRRAIALARIPRWADSAAIDAIYAEARRITAETGIPHHVDHKIPLHGKRVSGLHIETNLQILAGEENTRKSNRFEVDP